MSAQKARVCVVGSANVDLITYAPKLPALGETLPGSRFEQHFGGKGANQAVMAAKLGAEVTMVTRLGDDSFGRDYLDNFRRLGLDTSHVRITAEASTGVAPIWVEEESGNNQIIVVLGANELLSADDVVAARDSITSSAVLVCQWECPLPTTMAAMRIARDAGVTTIFNPAPARGPLPDEIYALCDFICPNESETERLTAMPVTTIDEIERAARVLRERGARAVLVTLGERGSMLVDDGPLALAPAPKAQAVDTTGAGDAFVGSFAFFLASGHAVRDAMERAGRVASISVQHRGAQPSYPRADELPAELFV
ncbi:MAG TPA: ribokinase [Acidimicrobiales bacterium]|nr:ribokinase [Acidimicrobiales bacterium]